MNPVLSYQEFLREIIQEIRKNLGTEYALEINPVLKNNSIELDGLLICARGTDIVPNIYLNDYYKGYEDGKNLCQIAGEILQTYDAYREMPSKDIERIYEFDKIKNNLIIHLVNYEKNARLLKSLPHLRFFDLAVTFHWLIQEDEKGAMAARITNEYYKDWNISIKELFALAVRNTKTMYPPILRNMEDILKELVQWEFTDISEDSSENVTSDFIDSLQNPNQKYSMYVLTNTKELNGAACILYPGCLEEYYKSFGTDFYILPSSIHGATCC